MFVFDFWPIIVAVIVICIIGSSIAARRRRSQRRRANEIQTNSLNPPIVQYMVPPPVGTVNGAPVIIKSGANDDFPILSPNMNYPGQSSRLSSTFIPPNTSPINQPFIAPSSSNIPFNSGTSNSNFPPANSGLHVPPPNSNHLNVPQNSSQYPPIQSLIQKQEDYEKPPDYEAYPSN